MENHIHEWQVESSDRTKTGSTATVMVRHKCHCGLIMETKLVFSGMNVKKVEIAITADENVSL